jgi:hypothetical protein
MNGGMNQGMEQTPGSMLEIYMHALRNSTADEFLDSVNLGVGNYDDGEYWQQIEAFRNGLYADTAMTRTIVERAKTETQKRMVDAIFGDGARDARILKHVDYPEPERGMTKQQYMDEHMEDVWEDLGVDADEMQYSTTEHQAWLVHVCTGLDLDWTPPHWRMLKARHEASRSKDARLLDNLFGRPPEPDPRPMEDFS